MSTSRSQTSNGDKKLAKLRYRRFIDGLLYLPSVQEIRAAVQTSSYDIKALVRVWNAYRAELQSAGKQKHLALLDHVYDQLRPLLEEEQLTADEHINNLQDLAHAATRSPTAILMRRLLEKHCDLLTDEAFQQILGATATPGLSPDLRNDRMKLLYCAALVTRKPSRIAKAYLVRGTSYREQGVLGKAAHLFARALYLAEKASDRWLQRGALGAQGSLYRMRRDFPRAVEVFERLLKLALDDGDTVSIVGFRDALGECYQEMGQYSRALDQLSAALGVVDNQGIKLRLLLQRGLVRESLGRYDQGLVDYEAARKVARQIGDRRHQFVALTDIALSYAKRGLSKQSYNELRKVLRTVESWGNPVMVASTHINLGNALMTLDRPAEALEHFRKAFQDKLCGESKESELTTLLGMGNALWEMDDRKAADTFYKLAMMPVLESGDAHLLSVYASNTAGRIDDDETDTIEWALRSARASCNQLDVAVLTSLLCNVLTKAGENERALALYRELIPDDGVEHPTAPEQLSVQIEYAQLLAKSSEGIPLAYTQLLRAMRAVEAEVQDTVLDERRSEIVSATIALYGALIELLCSDTAASLPNVEAPLVEAFNLHERAKARSFLNVLANSPVLPPPTVPDELTQKEAALLREERSLQAVDDVKSEQYRVERLAELNKELQSCRREMEAFAPRYVRWRSGDPIEFHEMKLISERLDEKTAVVSLFCGESATIRFVACPGWAAPKVKCIPVGRDKWHSIVRQIRRAFNGAPDEFPPYPPIRRDRPEERSLAFLDEIGAGVLDFLDDLEGVELLCVAPHGPLHLIPFHALRMPDGEYLATRCGVVYWPSISTALQLLESSIGPGKVEPTVLVAGVSATEDLHPEFFEQDADIFDPAMWDITPIRGVEAASRKNVLEALPEHGVIHLSCHGHFDERNALDSGLLFSDGERKAPRDLWTISILERARHLLTVRDLFGVRLNARIVTLNACSSGLQVSRNAGDELDGFARAILAGGASSVMLALWNVDQQTSQEFLSFFYRGWQSSKEPKEKWRALREAQLTFLASADAWRRHPYHWAPFALSGDWR